MKILVIDDTQAHLDAAKQTLVGHDVTCCATHEEAIKLLSEGNNRDTSRCCALWKQYMVEGIHFGDALDKAEVETWLPYWDVVLTDLLMPAGPMKQAGSGCQYVGQEMAVGWALALTAARTGVKYVAVVTDTNHHYHPASAMLDVFNRHFFTIDGARVHMTNHVSLVGIAGTEVPCSDCAATGKKKIKESGNEYQCPTCNGSGQDFAKKGKDWGLILEQLLKGETGRDSA